MDAIIKYNNNAIGSTGNVLKISTPELGTKTITAGGTYNAADDNLDGYSSVTVNVPNFMRFEKTISTNYVSSITVENVPFTVNEVVVYSVGYPTNNSGYYALTHGIRNSTTNFTFSHEVSNHKSKDVRNNLYLSQNGTTVTVEVYGGSVQFGQGKYVVMLFGN